MEKYAVISLETHLFFARIMKEHALFLEAGFPCKDKMWIQKADWFRSQFEELLRKAVELSDGVVGRAILESGEVVTQFTIPAEKRTKHLTGISIDSRIAMMELNLSSGCSPKITRSMLGKVAQLNEQGIRLLNGLITFKENILREVENCRLFTANYPLLIQHILREAKLYRSILMELSRNKNISEEIVRGKERFWNQIMMEHALFIRGLLDPSEAQLIQTADSFAMDYEELLDTANTQDWETLKELAQKSLEETVKFREFKTSGTEGILECSIASIILPLLADHVLREANHYIRLLVD
ncbi:MAG: DUF2935 domain-containing protein [Clostridiales bacterium]|nr:DUF2935 domain-containing protein [Clostridiales bacterium]